MTNYKIEQSAVQNETGQHEASFKIFGLLNYQNVTQVYKKGIALFDGTNQVCFDFSAVTHVDSSAIALLLSWLRYAKKHNKSFIFINLPTQLIEIAHVFEVVPLFNNYLNQFHVPSLKYSG